MKNVIATLSAIVLFGSAYAAEPTGSLNLELSSDNVYRGESITSDDFSAKGTVRISGLLLDGLYVEGSADSIGENKLESINLRARTSVGYLFNVRDIAFDGSVSQVFNPALQADDYTEVTLRTATNFRFAKYFDVYAHVSYAMDGVENLYWGAGVVARDVLLEGLSGRVGVNYYQYDGSDSFDFDRNNIEFKVVYDVWGDVSVFALHSLGNLGFLGQEIDDQTLFGVKLSF